MFAACMWMNICSTPVKAIKAAWKNAKTCSRNGFSGTVHGQKSQRETHTDKNAAAVQLAQRPAVLAYLVSHSGKDHRVGHERVAVDQPLCF